MKKNSVKYGKLLCELVKAYCKLLKGFWEQPYFDKLVGSWNNSWCPLHLSSWALIDPYPLERLQLSLQMNQAPRIPHCRLPTTPTRMTPSGLCGEGKELWNKKFSFLNNWNNQWGRWYNLISLVKVFRDRALHPSMFALRS